MRLRSIHFKNVKRLRDLKLSFVDEIRDTIRDRTVIVGKNGSGKTTLLEAIYEIVKYIGVRERDFSNEIDGLLEIPAATETCLVIREEQNFVVRSGDDPLDENEEGLYFKYDQSGQYSLRRTPEAKQLLQAIEMAKAGIAHNRTVGNLLYFPTDRITHFYVKGGLLNEQPDYKWCYKYDRNRDEWNGSIESFLCWLYFYDLKIREDNPTAPSKFAEIKDMINRFLEDKAVRTVNLNYRVELEDTITGENLSLEDLSSGEKQVILLVVEIYRYITKGSIIMIDEPELHLHPVWQRILVDTLTRLCNKYEAQLILTTQSPEIVRVVMRSEVISLDNLIEESEA